MTSQRQLFTVGYSNAPLDHFLGLLRAHGIEIVRDIRTTPESAYAKQFGSDVLRMRLRKEQLEYRLDGAALGGHPKEKRLYLPDLRVNFPLLEREPQFREALRELSSSLAGPRTALACTEGDPLKCPRSFLIGRILSKEGVDVIHILQDSSARTHAECEDEMLRVTGLATEDLFSSREERLAQAYAILMERYDHRWKDPSEREWPE